jgi:hypothetical protein
LFIILVMQIASKRCRVELEGNIEEVVYMHIVISDQEVTKKCRLSWLTNSVLINEPKCEGWGGGGSGFSANKYSYAQCTWSPKKLWRSNSIWL